MCKVNLWRHLGDARSFKLLGLGSSFVSAMVDSIVPNSETEFHWVPLTG